MEISIQEWEHWYPALSLLARAKDDERFPWGFRFPWITRSALSRQLCDSNINILKYTDQRATVMVYFYKRATIRHPATPISATFDFPESHESFFIAAIHLIKHASPPTGVAMSFAATRNTMEHSSQKGCRQFMKLSHGIQDHKHACGSCGHDIRLPPFLATLDDVFMGLANVQIAQEEVVSTISQASKERQIGRPADIVEEQVRILTQVNKELKDENGNLREKIGALMYQVKEFQGRLAAQNHVTAMEMAQSLKGEPSNELGVGMKRQRLG